MGKVRLLLVLLFAFPLAFLLSCDQNVKVKEEPEKPFQPEVLGNLIDPDTGEEVPNTTPFTYEKRYNLHMDIPGANALGVRHTPLDSLGLDFTSPEDDLDELLRRILQEADRGFVAEEEIQQAIDILEGNPIPGKAYSGFPLIHYKSGAPKLKTLDENGNVEVTQIWYDRDIDSDTYLVEIPEEYMEKPFSVTYHIRLIGSFIADEWAPFEMLKVKGPEGIRSMDASFYTLVAGQQQDVKIAFPPGKYVAGVYHWGWQYHPDRIQFMAFTHDGVPPFLGLQASKIEDLSENSPERKIHAALRQALQSDDYEVVQEKVGAVIPELTVMKDREKLPPGFEHNPEEADETLVFMNNEIYGYPYGRELSGNQFEYAQGATLRVKVINDDNFRHFVKAFDFGSSRHQFSRSDFGILDRLPVYGFDLTTTGALYSQVTGVDAATVEGFSDDWAMGRPLEPKSSLVINIYLPFDKRRGIYIFDAVSHDNAIWFLE
ncbi:MAG: hypothetical protein ACE5HO_13975 [bacterium]